MKTTLRTLRTLALGAATLLAASAHAHGDITCAPDTPKAEWRGQMELQRQLESQGWKVRQVKTTNNCYEVYGFDAQKKRVEVFFHPKSFEKVAEVPQP